MAIFSQICGTPARRSISASLLFIFALVCACDAIDLEPGQPPRYRPSRFSPDSKSVLLLANPVRLYDVESGKLKVTFKGHSEEVRDAVFSPDGRSILTGGGKEEDMGSLSSDNSARLWDAASGKELRRFIGHSGYISRVQFTPDGNRILTMGADHSARLWRTSSGEQSVAMRGLMMNPRAKSAILSSDGKKLATIVGNVIIFDVVSGRQICTIAADSANRGFNCVEFNPVSDRIVTASGDQAVRVWDASTGVEITKLVGHTGNIQCVMFSADGARLLSGSRDETVRLWDKATGKQLRCLNCSGGVWDVVLSDDGTRCLVTWDNSGNPGPSHGVSLWDIENGRELRTDTSAAFMGGFSRNSAFALVGQSLWRASTGATVHDLK